MTNNTWATVKIYNGVPFTKDKNFAVDDIATYLAAIPATRYLDFSQYEFNYFKQGVNATVKIQLDQNALSFNASNYNYAEITNWRNPGIPDKKVYYFIDSMSWTSKSVITLTLTMDTVNTIGLLTLTDKTLIHRQHKDRFKIVSNRAIAIVDKAQEGINPILYKAQETKLEAKRKYINCKWYLVYRTTNDPDPTTTNQINPVNTLLVPEYEMNVQYGGGISEDIGAQTPFRFYKYYTFSSDMAAANLSVVISPAEGTTTYRYYNICEAIPEREDGPTAAKVYYYLTLAWSSNTSATFAYKKKVLNAAGTVIATTVVDSGTIKTFQNPGSQGYIQGNISIYGFKAFQYYYESDSSTDPGPFVTPNVTTYTGTQRINDITAIDKTDPRLIKIIELPYCPLEAYEPVISSGAVCFKDSVGFTSEIKSGRTTTFLSLTDTPKNAVLETNLEKFNEMYVMNLDPTTLYRTQTRYNAYEMKLFNSEFFKRKFVYDSFVHEFKYEEADIQATYNLMDRFKFKFITSLAITSKFAFDFSASWTVLDPTEDYPNVLTVARNNEIPIYTNQYLTYLRTGLQYDLKAINRQKEADIGNIVLSTIGGLAGAALGVASGNYAVTAASLITAATSVTSSIVSAVNRSVSATQSMEQKIAQMKAQSASVQASDDLDIMRAYTEGNWAKVNRYEPSEKMKSCLFDLFFFTGYKCEYMEKPNLNTRNRFNFISASIDIDTEVAGYIYQHYTEEIINDYKARFENGLTIIHHYNNEWDFDQKYENWETILENYLQ